MGCRPRGPTGRLARGARDIRPGVARVLGVGLVGRPQPHQRPRTVQGTGETETAALRDLDDRLRGVPKPDGTRMEERERRFRLTYLAGAEESSRERLGR